MNKIALLFPGQGAQYPGMGKPLYETEREIFDMAEKFRPGITKICFEGTPDDLKKTENTQPCLYLAELAAANSLLRAGIKPDALAGFSLGEIVALAVGGAYSYGVGFEIVCRRGELMAKCSEKFETGMFAVLSYRTKRSNAFAVCTATFIRSTTTARVRSQWPDSKPRLDAAKADFTAAGAKVIPGLAVSGGFHSPFMDEAAEKFREFLAGRDVGLIEIPVWANCNAEPYGDDVWSLMETQINHPVRFEQIIRNMANTGVDTFIEVGPGQTLSKFVKKILPDATTLHAETPEEIAAVKEVLA